MKKGHGLILFDLDGTLVDSAPDIAQSTDEMLAALDRSRLGRDRITAFIGNGADTLIHRALSNDINGRVDADLFERAYQIFLKCYDENIFNLSRVYDGVESTLIELRRSGWQLACVTNKPARFTAPLLAAIGFTDYFSIVLSGDSLAAKKPSPDPILHAADACGFALDACVMVGDSLSDIHAAQAAGIPIVWTTYGYHQGLDPDVHQPNAIISSMPALLPWLAEHIRDCPRSGKRSAELGR